MKRVRKLDLRWDHPSDHYLQSFFLPFCVSMTENSRAELEEVNISVILPYKSFRCERYLRKELSDALRRIIPSPANLRSVTFNGICAWSLNV